MKGRHAMDQTNMTNGGETVAGRFISNPGQWYLPWTPEGAQALSTGDTSSATRAGVGGEKKTINVFYQV